MLCPHCGRETPKGERCEQCGGRLSTPVNRSSQAEPSPESGVDSKTRVVLVAGVAALLVVLGALPIYLVNKVKPPPPPPPSSKPKPPPAAPSCPSGDCSPFDEAFKSEISFGMTADEAAEALPELADAKSESGKKVAAKGAEGQPELQATLPGTVLRTVVPTSGVESVCDFEFLVDGKLSAIACEIDSPSRDAHSSSTSRIVRQLTERYGAPTDSGGHSTVLGDEVNERLTRDWVGDDGHLHLVSKYTRKPPAPTLAQIRVEQHTKAHDDLVEQAREASAQRVAEHRKSLEDEPL